MQQESLFVRLLHSLMVIAHSVTPEDCGKHAPSNPQGSIIGKGLHRFEDSMMSHAYLNLDNVLGHVQSCASMGHM